METVTIRLQSLSMDARAVMAEACVDASDAGLFFNYRPDDKYVGGVYVRNEAGQLDFIGWSDTLKHRII